MMSATMPRLETIIESKEEGERRYPFSLLDEERYQDELKVDERDRKTPDDWVKRHPEMTRLTGLHPFNSEGPMDKLMQAGFLTPSAIHYTRNHGAVPKLTWEDHRLEIVADEGDEARGFMPRTLTMDDIAGLPTYSVPCTLTCAGNRRKEQNLTKRTVGFSWNTTATSTAVWTGVRLRDVLLKLCNLPWYSEDAEDAAEQHAQFDVEERYVWMVGADELPKGNYGTCLPLGLVMDASADVLLAFKVNGKPLPPDRGFPIRVVVPGWIGGRMVKWLKRLEIRRGESTNHYHYFDNRILPPDVTKDIADEEGWWMRPEYLFNELNINSVITSPFHGDAITLSDDSHADEATVHMIGGYAYSGGGRRITRVEVSFDYGHTWELADLHVTERPNRYRKYWCWVFWTFEATLAQLATPHRMVHCRAWDQANNTQPNRLTWNVMGMGNNYIFGMRVDHCEQADTGLTELRFVHPTREAGMTTVGWQPSEHSALPAEPPVSIRRIRQGISWSVSGSEDGSTDIESMIDTPCAEEPGLEGLPAFSMTEVAQHDTDQSAWIVVRDKVYDCTTFLEEHPGGGSSIVMNAGTDATEDFEGIHSSKAQAMLKNYLIGRLATGAAQPAQVATPASPAKEETWLAAKHWTRFYLADRVQLTSNTLLLTFGPTLRSETPAPRPLGLPVGMHVMLKLKVGGESVIRAYTPILHGLSRERPEQFTLLVKVYRANEDAKFPEGGKMTQALDGLSVDDCVEVKGPCGHIEYRGNGKLSLSGRSRVFDEIGFMCGGTGITPAFRVIQSALANPNDPTVFRLLFANRSVPDILLREELDALAAAHPKRLHVHYTVSAVPADEEWPYSVGFIDEDMVRKHMPDPRGTRSFVGLCGPPPMIKFACIPNLDKLGFSGSSYDSF